MASLWTDWNTWWPFWTEAWHACQVCRRTQSNFIDFTVISQSLCQCQWRPYLFTFYHCKSVYCSVPSVRNSHECWYVHLLWHCRELGEKSSSLLVVSQIDTLTGQILHSNCIYANLRGILTHSEVRYRVATEETECLPSFWKKFD